MSDDFSEGWIEFEEFIDTLISQRNLSKADIKQYFEMYMAKRD